MITYVRFILRHRPLVLLFFGGVTLVFARFMLQATISSSPGELFFGQSPQYAHYLERTAEFGSDISALIAFEGDDLLSPEALKRLNRVIEAIKENPEIERVQSLDSAQHIESRGDDLLIDKYADLLAEHPERRPELLKTLNTDELTRDWLVTPDGRTSIIMVEFAAGDQSMEAAPRFMEEINRAFERFGFDPGRLYRGGLVPVMAAMLEEAVFSLKTILPVTAALLFFSVWVMFRRLWPVILTAAITAMAIVWTLGLAVILYGHINIFTTMMPALILIICFADVLHLCSAYLLELTAGRPKDEAILVIGEEVGTACAFTTITTFCGFASMALVPSPIFKQLGVLMGFGVACALFMALTLVPVFLSYLPAPKPWGRQKVAIARGGLDRFLEWTADLALNRPRMVNAVFIILLAASCVGMYFIHFETRFSRRFGEDNPIRVSVRYFSRHFNGVYPLDVYLDAKAPQGFLDPDLFARVARFEEWLEGRPEISQVVSVVDLVRKLYQEINPEMARVHPLPDTRQALAQLLLVFEMSGGEDLDRLMDRDYGTIRMTARLPEMGVIDISELGREIVRRAERDLGDAAGCETLSMEYLLGDWVDDIVRGQRKGLVMALITIAGLMILAVRSVRIGLVSMLPNVLPLLLLLGYLGLFWDVVDTDTMAVLMVAIGIGVDDTIHFLLRLRFESAKTDDPSQAVRRTFHYSGRAIVITSVILTAGFLPFAWSDYFSVRIMGTLLPFCIVSALAADIFWAPALVRLGWIGFGSKFSK